MEMKLCKKCEVEKPNDRFPISGRGYRTSPCKDCKNALGRERYRNPLPPKVVSDPSSLKLCKKCGEKKPIEQFRIEKGYRSSPCKECERRRDKATTPLGIAKLRWRGMNTRCGKLAGYKAIKILCTREEFLAWAVPAIETFLQEHPGETPSIDRHPDPDGHYQLGNMRIISLEVNKITRRYFGKNAHLLPTREKQTLLGQFNSKQYDLLELTVDELKFVFKGVLERICQESVMNE